MRTRWRRRSCDRCAGRARLGRRSAAALERIQEGDQVNLLPLAQLHADALVVEVDQLP